MVIKETFDKLKTHTYDIQIDAVGSEFECKFLVNNVVMGIGQGKKKKDAKLKSAEVAYDKLLELDNDFGLHHNKIIAKLDYQKLLIELVYDKNFEKVIFREVASSKTYWIIQCSCGARTTEASGISVWSARNFAAYKMLRLLNQNEKTVIKQEEVNQQVIDPGCVILSHNNNAQLAFQLARNLALQNEDYDQFYQFVTKLAAPYISMLTVGGYTLQSLRIVKPELDLVVWIQHEEINQFDQHIKQIMKENKFTAEQSYKDNYRIELNQAPTMFNKSPLKCPRSLTVNIYCKYDKSDNVVIEHHAYMQNYKHIYQQQLYSTLTLMLIHQWRDDSKQRTLLPVEILDYLIVQVTNEFKSLNSPYQVLTQVIYLLKNDILTEILRYPTIELNPFLQTISSTHLLLIQQLGVKAQQVRDIARMWDTARLHNWLCSY